MAKPVQSTASQTTETFTQVNKEEAKVAENVKQEEKEILPTKVVNPERQNITVKKEPVVVKTEPKQNTTTNQAH